MKMSFIVVRLLEYCLWIVVVDMVDVVENAWTDIIIIWSVHNNIMANTATNRNDRELVILCFIIIKISS